MFHYSLGSHFLLVSERNMNPFTNHSSPVFIILIIFIIFINIINIIIFMSIHSD